MSTEIKHGKTQLPKTVQPGGFPGALLDKFVGQQIKVFPLAKNVLGSLRIMAWIDCAIQRKMF